MTLWDFFVGYIDPHTTSVDPHTIFVDPNTISVDLPTISVDPNTISVDPNTTSVDPNTISVDPPTISVDPYTISLDPKIGLKIHTPLYSCLWPEDMTIKDFFDGLYGSTHHIFRSTCNIFRSKNRAKDPYTLCTPKEVFWRKDMTIFGSKTSLYFYL